MKVLLTGAAGHIGRCLGPAFGNRYELRTLDRQPNPADPGQLVADLTDADALRNACAGIEVIVHLAASSSDKSPFVAEIVPNNIVGLYHLLEAARQQSVRRVVFASTAQATSRYPADRTVTTLDPVRPEGPYGATKVFGEALGRMYHEAHGLEFIAIRIGAFQAYDTKWPPAWLRRLWLSPRDCVELFRCAVERPGVGYAIVYGTSALPVEYLSRREAREILGYEPRDRWEEYFGGQR